jgi:hypothetical protein
MDDNEERQKRFLEELMALSGEAPVDVLVRRIKTEFGDDDASIRVLMGHLAFWAQCIGQSDDPLDQQSQDRLLELIIALSGAPPIQKDE